LKVSSICARSPRDAELSSRGVADRREHTPLWFFSGFT